MNERTHFFIKIYLSHFILERVDVGCVWEISWRWGQTVILTQSSSFDHSSTSSSSWLGYSTVGHWGPKALCLPLALTQASFPQLAQAVCVLVILLFNVHLLPLFFRLFTQVHLLIDGSVEGQYVQISLLWSFYSHVILQNCFVLLLSYNPTPGFYPRFSAREGSDHMYSLYFYILLPILWDIFPSHW